MSILDLLEPVYTKLPEIKVPEVQPPLKKKLFWSAIVLVLFFVMGQIELIGLEASAAGALENIQVILASNIGTIITVGIGPIVLASIILQLLVGGKLIDIDLTNPRDKARFTGLQKLFAIILCVFEAIVYVVSGMLTPMPGMMVWVVVQVALGSILLLYMDEVVSKYGIGSGIGLFIAGGVAQTIFWGLFGYSPVIGWIGIIPLFIESFATGIQFILLLPIIATLIVFFVVVYAEGMHVNIPITMGRRGTGGRFPVKLLYVSNIPVILAVALFANIKLWASFTEQIPILNYLFKALASFTSVPYKLVETLLIRGFSFSIFGQMVDYFTQLQFLTYWNDVVSLPLGGQIIHALIYLVILIAVCIVFGKFWVEMGGQGPEAVSNQLSRSGMYIPGFRRDPRIIRGILDRYIPPIAILGSAFVGFLAGFADLTGALGSGTGILLTVGIVYRLYEELAKQQLMETHPLIRRLFGG